MTSPPPLLMRLCLKKEHAGPGVVALCYDSSQCLLEDTPAFLAK